MAVCPECKAQISDDANQCEYCGKEIYRGDKLSDVPKKITTWQKIVIVISIFILIAIGFSFKGAEKRENQAAQNKFANPAETLVADATTQLGLSSAYGTPSITTHFETNKGIVFVNFPLGPMTQTQASDFGLQVCRGLARAYVAKGYQPTALAVMVSSGGKNGTHIDYGAAVYNGNVDLIGWEPSKFTLKEEPKGGKPVTKNQAILKLEGIIGSVAADLGLASAYGAPEVSVDQNSNATIVFVDFPRGDISQIQASEFGIATATVLGKTYANPNNAPVTFVVNVGSASSSGGRASYGSATYSGNLKSVRWTPANPLTIDASSTVQTITQADLNLPVETLVTNVANSLGLTSAYGIPNVNSRFEGNRGLIFVDFPNGPMSASQASEFGLTATRNILMILDAKGTKVSELAISVGSSGKMGIHIHYGTALYNRNGEILEWQTASNN